MGECEIKRNKSQQQRQYTATRKMTKIYDDDDDKDNHIEYRCTRKRSNNTRTEQAHFAQKKRPARNIGFCETVSFME